jgi:hypothetical protein
MSASAPREQASELALVALLNTSNVAEAAKGSGISQRSLFRFLADEGFARRLREARARAMEQAIADLQTTATDAVSCLRRNLECGQPSVEVRAAATLMDLALRAREQMELGLRVSELERLLKGDGHETDD